MKAEDALFVLNGMSDFDLSQFEFVVITSIGSNLGRRVFELGEIMLLDQGGREPDFTLGRKPAKWDVVCEAFATLEEARAARERVLSGGTS